MKSNIKGRIVLIMLVILWCLNVDAQTPVNTGAPAPTRTPVTLPAAYNSNVKVNYVRTWTPSMPSADPMTVSSSARSVGEVKQTTGYTDGLGRPLQSVTKQISPTGQDLVQPVKYNDYGREQYKYLPYVSPANTGVFKLDPFNEQKIFLQAQYPGEQFLYSEIVYESSPLNRVQKSMAAGNSWVGSGKGTDILNQANTTEDGVRIWTIGGGENDIPVSSGAYLQGELYKDITLDEHGKKVIVFKDKEGQMILKKVELTGYLDGHAGWLCTYYIYDDLNSLRYVISPKAIPILENNGWNLSFDAVMRDELCFRYFYDERRRMIIKKVPGAAEVHMVYDVRDRLVFVQDGNMRAKTPLNQWLVTFYDELNRPTMTALYNSNALQGQLQSSLNTSVNNSQYLSYIIPGVSHLVVAMHDGRAIYEARDSITFEDGFDSGFGETQTVLNANATQGTIEVTVTNPLPLLDQNQLYPLTYTFYDKYGFTGAHDIAQSELSLPQAGSNPYAEQLTSASSMLKGLVTGTKVRLLGTEHWFTTTSFYDDKSRAIQTISDNISGGMDISTNLYDFSGTLLSNYVHHTNLQCGNTPDTRILTKMTYDAGGRLTAIAKKVNNEAERTIVTNAYEATGQLKTKTLGNNLEMLVNEYNIRGWLKSINKDYVAGATNTNYFGQILSYDYGFENTAYYNGNIAGIQWRGKNDGIARAYGYQYDAANRLKHGEFSQQNSGSTSWTKNIVDFTTSNLNYDENGNILFMNHQGMKAGVAGAIDQLTYTYPANSNKLTKVDDPNSDPAAGLGDFSNGANTGADYDYDANGNLKQDLNKNIQSGNIVYNHLNLPETITITGKGIIRYLYDATGAKRRKIVTDQSAGPEKVTTTDYMGGYVYVDNKLQFIAHEEGRIRPIGQTATYTYDYFIKDHLGNIRTVLTEQTDFSMYLASMETESAAKENALFSNIDASRSTKPAGYPQESSAKSNAYVAKLNADNPDKKIGPSIVLRVMAGDTISIGAQAFYKSIGNSKKKANAPASDMVDAMVRALGSPQGASPGGVHGGGNNTSPFNTPSFGNDYQQLKDKEPGQGTELDRPKAYLNFVLFDDAFKLVEENSGVKQVKAEPDQLQTLAQGKMVVKKSGFLYVYTSNEMPQDVYFDNVTLNHITGPLLEETHYYPYGLTMAGISSMAIGKLENKYKFNVGSELQSKEFSDGSGLELYDTKFRRLDPQIGRWGQLDSKPNVMESLYAAMGNNPIRYNDVLGDTLPSGRAIYDEGGWEEYNALLFETRPGGMYYGTDLSISLTFKERLYLIGHNFSIAMPTGKLLNSPSVWKVQSYAERGFIVESKLGGNLPKSFPVIDKYIDGVATSIKSIDMAADSYRKTPGAVFSKLKQYIDKLEGFTGGRRKGVEVFGDQIEKKTMEVGIQLTKTSLDQWGQILEAFKYAKQNNISIQLKFIK